MLALMRGGNLKDYCSVPEVPMVQSLSALKREAKENREKLGQLLTDLQATVPMMDDWRVAKLLDGFREVLQSLKEEE